jgi:hypothetical protein
MSECPGLYGQMDSSPAGSYRREWKCSINDTGVGRVESQKIEITFDWQSNVVRWTYVIGVPG